MNSFLGLILFACVLVKVSGSFEGSVASEGALGASAAAAGSGLLKSIWESYGNNMGSVNNLGSGSVTDQLGSTNRNRDNYGPTNGGQGYNPNTNRGQGYNPDSQNGQQGYWTRPPQKNVDYQVTSVPRNRPEIPRQSSERSGRNRFPEPNRIYDNVERETTVMLRVAPVLSQSTRNTPYEIVEAIFHGPWSWEWAAQHVYALHWDLEYRFDQYGDTVYTFGSRKESDGKLWGSLDKRAFTEKPAKYFFLGNITTSPKAATQAAFDNPLNGQPYDIMNANCQSWAVEHCRIMSYDLYAKMKNFPTLLESTKYAALWVQSALAATFYGDSARTPQPTPRRTDPSQLW